MVKATMTHTDTNNPYLPTVFTNRNNQTVLPTYDSFGNALTVTSARGARVTNTYQYSPFALGELTGTQTTHVTGGTTDATLQPTQFTYYRATDGNNGHWNGLIKTVTSPQPGTTAASPGAVTTSYIYTALGNVATITRPNANGTQTTAFNYTSWNPVPPNHSAFSQEEKLGQPLTVTVSGPDVQGTATQTVYYKYDGRGNVTAIIDALGHETNVEYNLADQVTKTLQPATNETGAGRTTTSNAYQYPGGPVSSTLLSDESGNAVRQVNYAYTAEGEIARVTGSTQPASYVYDGRGRVTRLTDGNQNSTNYLYDLLGNLTQVQYPLTPGKKVKGKQAGEGTFDTRTYAYDNDQNLMREIDGRGLSKTYTRDDPESRVTALTYSNLPAGVAPTSNVAFGYDAFGRMTALADGVTGTVAAPKTYSFDDLGNPLSITTNFAGGPQSQIISYRYNPDGSRKEMITPPVSGALTYGYEYDGVGRLTKALFPWTSGFVAHTYRDNGWLESSRMFRVKTNYEYNNRGLMTRLNNLSSLPISNVTISDFTGMTYDAAGNRRGMSANIPRQGSAPDASRKATFTYDTGYATASESRDVLLIEDSMGTGGNAAYNQTYLWNFGYDAAYNPNTVRNAAVPYNRDNQRIGAGFSYDGNGNPTGYASALFAFDAEDRLTQLSVPGDPDRDMTARYDANGLRAYRATRLFTLYYLYDEAGFSQTPLLEETFTGGVPAVYAANGIGADGVRARYNPTSPTAGTRWYFTFDPQGNLVQRQNEGNSLYLVTDTALYDAYGALRADLTPTTGGPSNHRDPVGFGGQWGYYTDYESGLLCLTHRYYDPASGRFVNRDPIGYQGGVNLYSFAGGNPVNNIDPMGTDFTDDLIRGIVWARKNQRQIAGHIIAAGMFAGVYHEPTFTIKDGHIAPYQGPSGDSFLSDEDRLFLSLPLFGAQIGKISNVPSDDFMPVSGISKSYSRPSGAGPTAAQTAVVQGKPCVECEKITAKQVADHIDPLVVEYYRTGKIDLASQTSLKAVQPHCPTCSNKQGGQLSGFSKRMKSKLGL